MQGTDLVLDGAEQVGCVTREEDVLIGTFSRFAGTSHDIPIQRTLVNKIRGGCVRYLTDLNFAEGRLN